MIGCNESSQKMLIIFAFELNTWTCFASDKDSAANKTSYWMEDFTIQLCVRHRKAMTCKIR